MKVIFGIGILLLSVLVVAGLMKYAGQRASENKARAKAIAHAVNPNGTQLLHVVDSVSLHEGVLTLMIHSRGSKQHEVLRIDAGSKDISKWGQIHAGDSIEFEYTVECRDDTHKDKCESYLVPVIIG